MMVGENRQEAKRVLVRKLIKLVSGKITAVVSLSKGSPSQEANLASLKSAMFIHEACRRQMSHETLLAKKVQVLVCRHCRCRILFSLEVGNIEQLEKEFSAPHGPKFEPDYSKKTRD